MQMNRSPYGPWWWLTISFPTIFFSASFLATYFVPSWDRPGTGVLVYVVPALSLTMGLLFVLVGDASATSRLRAVAVTLGATAAMCVVNLVLFGLIGLLHSGLAGTQ